jgi:uncharacterized membrane protein
MAMNAEERNRFTEDRVLKDLTPNVAAVLCYVVGWVSGIVFLVLEQKNRFIRFHALQSIIVFGTLTVAGAILGAIPVIGAGMHWAIFVFGFVLWLILIIKAANGELFKMPWAGNLSERLTSQPAGQATPQPVKNESAASTSTQSGPAAPAPARADRSAKAEEFRAGYYSANPRISRISSSAFAIAWSIALLIFFNFFSQYIAYYEPVHSGGTTYWQIHTLITSGFNAWLPILNTTLILSIIGHSLMIAFDKYILRQILLIILEVFGLATVVTLLGLFPFDFSSIPNREVIDGITIGLTVTLILTSIGFGIGALVKFVKLVVHAVEGKY